MRLAEKVRGLFRRANRVQTAAALVCCTIFVAGCGGDDDDESPPDVSGTYTLNVTNGTNDCLPLTGWQEGASFTDIPFDLVQNKATLEGTFQGLLATVFLQALIGANDFSGALSGRDVNMTRLGDRSQTSGTCTFTIRADLNATSDGDLLEGQIVYTPITNDDPNCESIKDCRAVQMFNGTRPPSK
jgi:hypothetical protein